MKPTLTFSELVLGFRLQVYAKDYRVAPKSEPPPIQKKSY